MRSFQSPEGTSTYNFPIQFGTRLSNEVLMLERSLSAQEAVASGFANAVIPELQDEPDWFDIKKVPAIGKLLATDLRTLVNCKTLLNQAKDNAKINEIIDREGVALMNSWKHPEFPEKMMNYMLSLMTKKAPKAKL